MDRRIALDILELKKKYPVDPTDSINEIMVYFVGPASTPYQSGIFKLRISLPPAYPLKSPSIAFVSKILHPNIDLGSGSICLDVINQTWVPMFSLLNVVDSFIPQLLTYPNPADPLNSDAARMLRSDEKAYHEQVRAAVEKHGVRTDCLPPRVPPSFRAIMLERGILKGAGSGGRGGPGVEGAGVGRDSSLMGPGDDDESSGALSLFDFHGEGEGEGGTREDS